MKLLFKYAVKWGYIGLSPMGNKYDKRVELPRGSTLRQKKPRTLTPKQFVLLFTQVPRLLDKLVLALVAWLGPRISEAFGLKWKDIDFLDGVVRFERGLVEGRLTALKTEASRDELPLPPEVATLLVAWHSQTPYRGPEDWVFASPETNGQRPYWQGQMLKTHVIPVGEKAGLGRIGWHAFRHSYTAWGKNAGLGLAELKELLRRGSQAGGQPAHHRLREARGVAGEGQTGDGAVRDPNGPTQDGGKTGEVQEKKWLLR